MQLRKPHIGGICIQHYSDLCIWLHVTWNQVQRFSWTWSSITINFFINYKKEQWQKDAIKKIDIDGICIQHCSNLRIWLHVTWNQVQRFSWIWSSTTVNFFINHKYKKEQWQKDAIKKIDTDGICIQQCSNLRIWLHLTWNQVHIFSWTWSSTNVNFFINHK